MQYVVSDIHGNYKKYKEIFSKIHFKEEDTLYVLGDCIDRGQDSLEILFDMMNYSNIIPILGNHEYIALYILRTIYDHDTTKLTDPSFNQLLNNWIENGGNTTIQEFKALTPLLQDKIIQYIRTFKFHIETTCNSIDYILVHASLSNFSSDRPLSDYAINELIYERTDYSKVYFNNKILVTGHTPTPLIPNNNKQQKIYKKNNHIAIDCGCGFGGKLAIYCLDTDTEYYL